MKVAPDSFSVHPRPNVVRKKRGRPRKRPLSPPKPSAIEVKIPESHNQIDALGSEPTSFPHWLDNCVDVPTILANVVYNVLEQAQLCHEPPSSATTLQKETTRRKPRAAQYRGAVKLPQPASLEMRNVSAIFSQAPSASSDYFVSLKADGVRCLAITILLPKGLCPKPLVFMDAEEPSVEGIDIQGHLVPAILLVGRKIDGNVSVLWSRGEDILDRKLEAAWFDPPSVFDAEACFASGTGELALQVFDCIVCNGRNVSKKTYFERTEIAKYKLWRSRLFLSPSNFQDQIPSIASCIFSSHLLPTPAGGSAARQGTGGTFQCTYESFGDGPLESLFLRSGKKALAKNEKLELSTRIFPKPIFQKSQSQQLISFLAAPTSSSQKQLGRFRESTNTNNNLHVLLKQFEYDGLIFTPNQATYHGYFPIPTTKEKPVHQKKADALGYRILKSFKWKPRSMITVDFYVKFPKENDDNGLVSTPLDTFPPEILMHSNYGSRTAGFLQNARCECSRNSNGAMYLVNRKKKDLPYNNEKKNWFLFSYLAGDGTETDRDNGVYECQCVVAPGGAFTWRIVRKRDDKVQPNEILTCLSAMCSMQENIRFDFLD